MMPPVLDPTLAALLAERGRADPDRLAVAMAPSDQRVQQAIAITASVVLVAVWAIGATLG